MLGTGHFRCVEPVDTAIDALARTRAFYQHANAQTRTSHAGAQKTAEVEGSIRRHIHGWGCEGPIPVVHTEAVFQPLITGRGPTTEAAEPTAAQLCRGAAARSPPSFTYAAVGCKFLLVVYIGDCAGEYSRGY